MAANPVTLYREQMERLNAPIRQMLTSPAIQVYTVIGKLEAGLATLQTALDKMPRDQKKFRELHADWEDQIELLRRVISRAKAKRELIRAEEVAQQAKKDAEAFAAAARRHESSIPPEEKLSKLNLKDSASNENDNNNSEDQNEEEDIYYDDIDAYIIVAPVQVPIVEPVDPFGDAFAMAPKSNISTVFNSVPEGILISLDDDDETDTKKETMNGGSIGAPNLTNGDCLVPIPAASQSSKSVLASPVSGPVAVPRHLPTKYMIQKPPSMFSAEAARTYLQEEYGKLPQARLDTDLTLDWETHKKVVILVAQSTYLLWNIDDDRLHEEVLSWALALLPAPIKRTFYKSECHPGTRVPYSLIDLLRNLCRSLAAHRLNSPDAWKLPACARGETPYERAEIIRNPYKFCPYCYHRRHPEETRKGQTPVCPAIAARLCFRCFNVGHFKKKCPNARLLPVDLFEKKPYSLSREGVYSEFNY